MLSLLSFLGSVVFLTVMEQQLFIYVCSVSMALFSVVIILLHVSQSALLAANCYCCTGSTVFTDEWPGDMPVRQCSRQCSCVIMPEDKNGSVPFML